MADRDGPRRARSTAAAISSGATTASRPTAWTSTPRGRSRCHARSNGRELRSGPPRRCPRPPVDGPRRPRRPSEALPRNETSSGRPPSRRGQGLTRPVRRREEALAPGHAVALVEEEPRRGGEVGAEHRRLPARRQVRDVIDADERRLRDQAGHGHLIRRAAGRRRGSASTSSGASVPSQASATGPGGGSTSHRGLPRRAPRRDSGW